MADLGCQDTDWVAENDKEVSDAILLQDGLKLTSLSMEKGKYAYLRCISGWFGALSGDLRVTDDGLRVLGYSVGRKK